MTNPKTQIAAEFKDVHRRDVLAALVDARKEATESRLACDVLTASANEMAAKGSALTEKLRIQTNEAKHYQVLYDAEKNARRECELNLKRLRSTLRTKRKPGFWAHVFDFG